jgi:hypothetical protein
LNSKTPLQPILGREEKRDGGWGKIETNQSKLYDDRPWIALPGIKVVA